MLRTRLMCLILFGWQAHAEFPLVLASNRDEFFVRPTAPADYWRDAPAVLAGRDLDKGGTWMGVTRQGRWAALTNFRDGRPAPAGSRSRGQLVAEYLTGDDSPAVYAAAAARAAPAYHGFNLLVGDNAGAYYVAHAGGRAQRVAAGIHGLSNHQLDTPWPKVEAGRQRLAAALRGTPDGLEERLLALLADSEMADDAQLPATGVSVEWEKRLSAAFIRAPGYGTRASTVLLIGRDGEVRLRERSFGADGEMAEDRMFRFTLDTAAAR
jgi:uncharacterized protein with NRDE domain